MELYKTVVKRARTEQVINKSRFITTVSPVESKEEADAFFDEIRSEFKDATHNVPAFVIGDKMQLQWGSDDGEPQGTSGAPIVQMLTGEELTNVALVVTRYFGGIKLGTGGLVRAYTGSAKQGIEAAGICTVNEMSATTYETDYSSYNRIENHKFDFEAEIDSVQYTDKVTFDLITDSLNKDIGKGILINLTGGSITEKCSKIALRKIKK